MGLPGYIREANFDAVSDGINRRRAQGQPGPYALFLSPSRYADSHRSLTPTLVTAADRMTSLLPGGFHATIGLPANRGLLVSLGEAISLWLVKTRSLVLRSRMARYLASVSSNVSSSSSAIPGPRSASSSRDRSYCSAGLQVGQILEKPAQREGSPHRVKGRNLSQNGRGTKRASGAPLVVEGHRMAAHAILNKEETW